MERISFLAEAIHVRIHSMLTPGQPSPPRKNPPPRLGHKGLRALGRTGVKGGGLILQLMIFSCIFGRIMAILSAPCSLPWASKLGWVRIVLAEGLEAADRNGPPSRRRTWTSVSAFVSQGFQQPEVVVRSLEDLSREVAIPHYLTTSPRSWVSLEQSQSRVGEEEHVDDCWSWLRIFTKKESSHKRSSTTKKLNSLQA